MECQPKVKLSLIQKCYLLFQTIQNFLKKGKRVQSFIAILLADGLWTNIIKLYACLVFSNRLKITDIFSEIVQLASPLTQFLTALRTRPCKPSLSTSSPFLQQCHSTPLQNLPLPQQTCIQCCKTA